ncbi:unnamed protein product [Cuscuta campestris]|uniref:Uncharacterized protein n=1 Tax=Cuscuta campestris TaxID=132261 RepID=A0A484KIR4_9ASTE|nr:unnamed protein product [Cuscuta campestris]
MSFSMWVGNVYQKFGAMCLGIEDAMYKDSIAYVENQVQTVGESVKRFCSEMVQDLHPASLLDPVGVVFADMSVNPYAYLEIEKKKKKENMKEHHVKSTDDTQVIKGRSTLGGIHRRRNVGTIKRTEGYDDLPLMASLPVTSKSWERKDMKSPVCEIGETSEEICDLKVGSPVTSKSWEGNKMKSPVCEIGETLEGTCDHKVDLPVTSKPWESNNVKPPVFEIGEKIEEIFDHEEDSNMQTTGISIGNVASEVTLLVGSPVCEKGESLEEFFVPKEDDKMQTTGSSIDNVASEVALLVGLPVCEMGEKEILDHKENNIQKPGSSIDNVASEVALLVGSPVCEMEENEIFDHKEDNNMQKTGSSIDNVASEVTLLVGSPVFEMEENEIFDHKEDNNMQKTGSSIDNVASEVALLVESPECEMGEKEMFGHKVDANMQTTGSYIGNVAYEVTLLAGSAGRKKQENFGCASAFDGSSSISSGTQEADMPNSTIWLSTISDSGISENHYFKVLDEANDVLEQEIDQDVEKTCVLVEGDGLLLPHGLAKHKSYKTKIREAFSSKKRSTKKEYQRLAKQYEQGLGKDCEGKNATPQISSGWDFPDSEWELL